jgi:3-dehydroquinate dehydratase-2
MTEPGSPARKVLLINGPNLNLLGTREPQIYGSTTLPEVVSSTIARGKDLNIEVVPFQSNHEGQIVDFIQSHFVPPSAKADATDSAASSKGKQRTAIILNPAAFTHTSVSIRDALLATSFPFVEVHISNIHSREPWRNHSYFSDKAVGVIMGLGVFGYQAALEFWAQRWNSEDGNGKQDK